MDISQPFLELACEKGALRFGQFVTKAGRRSPYFFNAGLFDDGEALGALCNFYAQTILQSTLSYDMLFGPAYKGIPLVAGVAIRLADAGHSQPFAFNRKEVKDHGEGGTLVGASLKGRVLILDDVITAGTSIRESVEIIRSHGAEPAGVVIALDRMERGQGRLSAVQEVQETFQIPVVSVANLDDLLKYVSSNAVLLENLEAVQAYRDQYGT